MTGVVGRAAVSLAGRDKGRAFFIVAEQGEYVLLCDGGLRKLERPKKKKRRHIRVEPQAEESVGARLAQGGRVEDYELRAALQRLGYRDADTVEGRQQLQ